MLTQALSPLIASAFKWRAAHSLPAERIQQQPAPKSVPCHTTHRDVLCNHRRERDGALLSDGTALGLAEVVAVQTGLRPADGAHKKKNLTLHRPA
jgi:hypothetical protein